MQPKKKALPKHFIEIKLTHVLAFSLFPAYIHSTFFLAFCFFKGKPYLEKGHKLAKENDHEQAEAAFTQIIQLYEAAGLRSSSLLEAYYHGAQSLEKQNKDRQAYLEKVVELYGDNNRRGLCAACTDLGKILFEKGDYEKSEAFLIRANNIAFTVYDPVKNRYDFMPISRIDTLLARTLIKQEKYSEARNLLLHLDLSYKLDGYCYNIEAYLFLGIASAGLGKHDEAQKFFEEAIQKYKSSSLPKPIYFFEAHYQLGLSLEKQGKKEEAKQAYGKTLALCNECTRPDTLDVTSKALEALERLE